MIINAFHSFKTLVRRLTVFLAAVVVFLSLTQTAVFAASSQVEKPGYTPGITDPVPDEDISEAKAQRREWQSKVSSARENQNDDSDSLGETLKKKLNLEEIQEGYHPEESEANR